MFSSPLSRPRRREGKTIAVPRRDTSTIADPVEEFNYLLDRLGCLIDLSKEDYEESLKFPADEKRSSFFGGKKKDKTKKKDAMKDESDKETKDAESSQEKKPEASRTEEPQANTSEDTAGKPPQSPKSSSFRPSSQKKTAASFIPIAEEEECIEIIRRLAELVIISERVVSTQMAKEDKKKKEEDKKKKDQQKKGWGTSIMDDDTEVDLNIVEEEESGSEAYFPIFDLFFERNTLGLIVDILVGESFKLHSEENAITDTVDNHTVDNPNSGEGGEAGDMMSSSSRFADAPSDPTAESKFADAPTEVDTVTQVDESEPIATSPCSKLLPSLKVATQAVQSVSLIVQNVARATSLYFILSNNYVNALIDLPLDLYAAAELEKQVMNGASPHVRLKTYSTPELADLTVNFVTFLKSLAMRMNTETLQFYLKYPTPSMDQHNANDDEEARARSIDFPLYARALDFCAAHHDSFVRVTAMNICLNTLRLTAVLPGGGKGDDKESSLGSSPDGVLHNANPLDFRERLAIATHTCAPSRVDRLAAPIVTKLSSIWCLLQEKFMDLDTHKKEDDIDSSKNRSRKKVTSDDLMKERERKHNAFKDVANTLQDQLLLLDDLLKVGLTALNEQIIEMMFATFVYPLLLQPLLVYYQQLANDSDADDTQPLQDPFSRLVPDRSSVDFSLVGRAPPEVTAPAKTALFTLAAVFHLISNRPFIRLLYTALFHPLAPDATDETVISAEKSVCYDKEIRVDNPAKELDERQTYPFGGKEQASSTIEHNEESCVFVLSPALAQVLMYKGEPKSGLPLTKTRLNPYRRAILQCLEAPHHMSDFRKLAFNTADAAFSFFSGEFLAETLLGNDFVNANRMDCDHKKLSEEIVSALCEGLINGKPGPFGTWKLQFDPVAAHAFLCAIWRSPDAIAAAAKIVEVRYRKAAVLLSEIPARIPTTQHLGSIMNLVFYEAASKRRKATFSDLFYMKETSPERFSTAIASSSTFRTLCSRSYEAPPSSVHLNKFTEHTAMDLGSSSCRAILKLDALSTFLNSVSKDKGAQIEGLRPSGFALSSDRGIVSTEECYIEELKRSIHSYLSSDFCRKLTGADTFSECPVPGSTVALAGRNAMPCVCEAPASTTQISNTGAKMIVEGITWQSLYLAFFGSYLVLAEPAAGSPGQGRIVTSCPLCRISVARDPNPPADPNSPARRLLMAHKWFEIEAPGLFHYDAPPKVEDFGPFNKVKLWRSKLDVWFEDEDAAAHAYHTIHFQVDKTKTLRGDGILDYLTQANGFDAS